MAAFDRVCSGIPALDRALDNIRMGDNVVWQVSSLEEYRVFARAFAAQAIRDGRNLLYIRFADHEPILEPADGLRIVPVELSHRFETFTIRIHELIEKEGRDAFYVFDCLSELEEAWATDLMMGNFFRLTCPFLFVLDTVAFFPVIRGRHSFDAIAKIRETTQLFLDVFPGAGTELYVRPVKVWERTGPTMFQPHLFRPESGELRALSEGVEISRFYREMNLSGTGSAAPSMDSWERFFQRTKMKYENGEDVTAECGRICDIMLTRDERLRELIKRHFAPRDYFEVHSRMVGTGMIGGKACGMLLSRKITENLRPDIYERVEPHDSFYIGSDVFYSFIVDNGFWDLKIRQRTGEGYFALAEEFAQRVMEGALSPAIEDAFRQLLDYFGGDPVIVRSSSILEDGFGNAFAGKYESVFCGSQGSLEERLAEFEQAIRTVYASTVSMSALDYRKRRGLEDLDEQMALLVQRVSGSRHDGFFMPCAAGVGYSVSPYRFANRRGEKGMLRLVAGLGTAAVDRRTGSYPRIVSLDDPSRELLASSGDKHRFSQRLVDLIDLRTGRLDSRRTEDLENALPPYQRRLLYSHDTEAERSFRDRGQYKNILFVSCDGIVKNKTLMSDMSGILECLQREYDHPVDIEYTVNFSPEGDHLIDLLQCRPLTQAGTGEAVSLPGPEQYGTALVETKGVSMGFSRSFAADVIVYIDATAYYRMPYAAKYRVKTALSAVNWHFQGKGKRLVLITPGRIGTSSPELGVPSAFADISEFNTIIEVSETEAGYMPELSYGSHFFQDLVEAGILYTAVFKDSTTLAFAEDRLRAMDDASIGFAGSDELKGIVHVIDAESRGIMLYYDMISEHLLIADGKEG
ncbi:MAG: phosphoenolpyruvate synthase [Oscillospiraceae bacterium]|nr:phosphoenolpyruvate synthase [Oscillospiraceae bacterium]